MVGLTKKPPLFLWVVLGLIFTLTTGCDKLSQLNLPVPSRVTQPATPGTATTSANVQTNAPAVTPLPTLPLEGPEKSVADRCQALIQKDFTQAVALLSDYSLKLAGLSRQDIIVHYQTQDFKGWRLVDYRVLESKKFDNQTMLVHLLMKEQTGEQEPQYYDGWQVLRLEGGKWLVNWQDVIDTLPLAAEAQKVNDIIIQPVQMIRYANRLRLVFNVDNTSKRPAFWNLTGLKAAAFYFNDHSINVYGENTTPLMVDAGSSSADISIEVPGLQATYPIAVDLTNWTGPDSKNPTNPSLEGQKWLYKLVFQAPATQTP